MAPGAAPADPTAGWRAGGGRRGAGRIPLRRAGARAGRSLWGAAVGASARGGSASGGCAALEGTQGPASAPGRHPGAGEMFLSALGESPENHLLNTKFGKARVEGWRGFLKVAGSAPSVQVLFGERPGGGGAQLGCLAGIHRQSYLGTHPLAGFWTRRGRKGSQRS